MCCVKYCEIHCVYHFSFGAPLHHNHTYIQLCLSLLLARSLPTFEDFLSTYFMPIKGHLECLWANNPRALFENSPLLCGPLKFHSLPTSVNPLYWPRSKIRVKAHFPKKLNSLFLAVQYLGQNMYLSLLN